MACNVHALLSQVAAEYERLRVQNASLLNVTDKPLKDVHEGSGDDQVTTLRTAKNVSMSIPFSCSSGLRPSWNPRLFRLNSESETVSFMQEGACVEAVHETGVLRKDDSSCVQVCAASSLRFSDLDEGVVRFGDIEDQYQQLESDAGPNESDAKCVEHSSTSRTVTTDSQNTINEIESSETIRGRGKLHDIWQQRRPRYGLHRMSGSHLSLASHESLASLASNAGKSYQLALHQMRAGPSGVARAMSKGMRAGDALKSDSYLQHIVMRPNCWARTLWDFLTALVISFDMCVIPLQAFDIHAPTLRLVSDFYTTLFWSLDLVASFCVGYHYNGVIEMRPGKIALRYLKTCFLADLAMASVDWLFLLSSFSPVKFLSLLRVAKAVRIVRVLRALRLARLVKGLLTVFPFCGKLFISDGLSMAFSIWNLICFLVVSAHFIACGWYAIGKLKVPGSDGESWLLHVEAKLDDEKVESPALHFYTIAMHWALTQFTPASMEVTPRNWAERVYAILVLLFGLLVFSSIISRITASMTRLRDIRAEDCQKMDKLHKYVAQHKTTLELNCCIYSYLKHHHKEQRQRLHMPEVDYLNVLPDSLRSELCVEIFAPALMAHPLFEILSKVDEPFIISLCKSVISEKFVAREESLFSSGDGGEQMWYVTSGTLQYDLGHWKTGAMKKLKEGIFVSEITLWIDWKFEGNLMAKKPSEVFALEAEAFCHAAQKTGSCVELQNYAQAVAACLRRTPGASFEVVIETDECYKAAQSAFDSFVKLPVKQFEQSSMYKGMRNMRSFFQKWLSADSDESV